jgi:hypothetical protein
LQTGFHESGREGSVIAVEDHVDGCERTKRGLLVVGDLGRNNPRPEWIKRSSGENGASAVGIKNEIIKCKLTFETLMRECKN